MKQITKYLNKSQGYIFETSTHILKEIIEDDENNFVKYEIETWKKINKKIKSSYSYLMPFNDCFFAYMIINEKNTRDKNQKD